MFAEIPRRIRERMDVLERRDARDRADGTPKTSRLKQIPQETGRLLALLAASAPPGRLVEIGTSAGYSTLWLCLACRSEQRRVTTFEVLAEKADLARETFAETGVEDVVDFVHGDAREFLGDIDSVGFCFLDADKDVYRECYEAVVPKLVTGGILVADNVVSHAEVLRPWLDHALADHRVDATVVPIGKGLLVCRKK